MLFNSYEFILFLILVLVIFHSLGKLGCRRLAILSLVGSSLFFYGWWNPAYLGLITASILVNYVLGYILGKHCKEGRKKKEKLLLIVGILFNLGLLGYFKYANFFVDNFAGLFHVNFNLEQIILPLAISFFSFQQIAYLVDAYRGETREYSLLHYCLFVTFFPQLIAGPIVHHKEMMPQFSKSGTYRLHSSNLAIGFTIFIIGLFKKVLIADSVASYSNQVFGAASAGIDVGFAYAWLGALAYTLQLYFDFSAYSDMAIGIARMFGIKLPLNFESPYKARNIIEFWRRWHITLSRFLRDYLYIPLGGNRKGNFRRYSNILITMALGGLWHGAGWTFVFWGALHGMFLVINHGWHVIRRRSGHDLSRYSLLGSFSSRTLTFMLITIAWVLFRSENLNSALILYEGMLGMHGFGLMVNLTDVGHIILLLAIVWFLPNTQEWISGFNPALDYDPTKLKAWSFSVPHWQPTKPFAILMSLVMVFSILYIARTDEFIYFQF